MSVARQEADGLAPAKVRLIQVAKRRVGMSDDDYRAMLFRLGGVGSSRDLDPDGFEAVMGHFRQLGFVSDFARGTFGDRPGYATPAQVRLAQRLWSEYAPDASEGEFRAWLERFHAVSSLRFADRGTAHGIITALRAMASRGRSATERPADRDRRANG